MKIVRIVDWITLTMQQAPQRYYNIFSNPLLPECSTRTAHIAFSSSNLFSVFSEVPLGQFCPRSNHLCSQFLSRKTVVVEVCVSEWRFPALVSHPQIYFKKTPITSAGMSRQATTTYTMVGCLNSCHTVFMMCLCLSSSAGYSALQPAYCYCTMFILFSLHQQCVVNAFSGQTDGYEEGFVFALIYHSQLYTPDSSLVWVPNAMYFYWFLTDLSVVFSCGHLRLINPQL